MTMALAVEIDGITRDARLTPTGEGLEVRVTSRRGGREAAGRFSLSGPLNRVVAEVLACRLLGRPLEPPLQTRSFTLTGHQDL